jgi:predicted RecA/RadA family phage recombinase
MVMLIADGRTTATVAAGDAVTVGDAVGVGVGDGAAETVGPGLAEWNPGPSKLPASAARTAPTITTATDATWAISLSVERRARGGRDGDPDVTTAP